MVFGNDFKYRIPEMDRLIGAAVDLGIHFDTDYEAESLKEKGIHVCQNVMVKIHENTPDETFIFLQVMKNNPAIREALHERICT